MFETAEAQEIRSETREICARFPPEYWRRADLEREYPQAFVDQLASSGLLSCLIPTEFGGRGLTIASAAVVVEEIHRSGGNASACHAQLYIMGALLRHGSRRQQERYLPGIASGDLRLQAFSITEHDAGSDTTAISTRAERDGQEYVITGEKNWTSRMLESDLALVLARSDSGDTGTSDGLTLFLLDLGAVREQQPEALEVTPVRTMFNYATNRVSYRGLRTPADSVVGDVGQGFRHVLDGWNAERILLASEAIGDGYWFIDKATEYAKRREVFGRPIGRNQGVQFPITEAYMKVRAADLMRTEATRLFAANKPCGAEANMAKYLAGEASWLAANACLNTFGGYGFVDEYDVERKFRETRLFQIAPVNDNLVKAYVGTKVLGMPRTY